jgi:curved DNA-binding protein CbpA
VGSLNHYQLLGLRADAQSDEVETAFRRRAARMRAGTPEFDRLLDAYTVLKDPASRARYDAQPEVRDWIHQQQRPSWQFWRKNKPPSPAVEKPPTFSQLLDFDWESLEEPEPDAPDQRKAFYEEIYFKVAVVAIVLAAIAVIFWALRNS